MCGSLNDFANSQKPKFKTEKSAKFHFAKYREINGTTRKILLRDSFHLNVYTRVSYTDPKVPTTLYMKVLFNCFHLNGHTLGFHPRIQKFQRPCA